MENEKYLIINAGSSSLKFSLYEMPSEKEVVNGYVEKIGLEDCFFTLKFDGKKIEKSELLKDHNDAVASMLRELLANNFIADISEIKGVGHRVLHGGEFYDESVVIDDEVLQNIIKLTKLGPLHHPGQISGIMAMQKCLKNVEQVAVFDTAFHQSIPEVNYMYPIPYEYYEKHGVRKYGFHGTSHKYITELMKERLNKENPNLIICHIGSGASICAVKEGKSYNTSMGLTPLDGIMMGTRSGGIDPSIVEYICKETNLSVGEITKILNNKSGLIGISGKSDMRDVRALMAENDKKAILAYTMYCNSIVNYIAQYIFQLDGKIDAICFTAGVGENNPELRQYIVNKLSNVFDIKLDKEKNDNISKNKAYQNGIITTIDSSFKVFVEQTDEEIMILRDTYKLVNTNTKVKSFNK